MSGEKVASRTVSATESAESGSGSSLDTPTRSSPTPQDDAAVEARAKAYERIASYMLRSEQSIAHGPPSGPAESVYRSGAYSARSRDKLHGAVPHAPLSARQHAVPRHRSWTDGAHEPRRGRMEGRPFQPIEPADATSHAPRQLVLNAPLWRPQKWEHAFQQHFRPLERARRRRIELGAGPLQPIPLRLPPIEEAIWATDYGPRALRHAHSIEAPSSFPSRYLPSARAAPVL